ncbi:hypothetical protein [Roseateles sp.]|uniref:hypothetical protein n=1 Tax=Roseateles sp. TaxID=1971397 RepID=UPI003264CE7F
MKLINHGITSAKHDLQELIEGAQAERSVNLDHLRSLQLASQLLVQREAQRLARRNTGDVRIARLGEIERKLRERVGVLDTEREVAAIRVPPVTKTGALIHGRVTDSTQRAAGPMNAVLVKADGKPVEGVPSVKIDESGYYAFVLDEKQTAALGDGAKLQVVLQSADAKIAPASTADITLKAGTVVAKDVVLSTRDIDELKLRPHAKAEDPGSPKPAPRGATKPRK